MPRPHFIPTRRVAIALTLSALLCPPVPAHAKPYQQGKGWYTIEVPEGFQPKKVDDLQTKFESKGGDAWFTLNVIPGASDLDLLTVTPLTWVKKIMPGAIPDGEPQEFTVDGHRARWMIYRGTMVASGRTSPLAALAGAIELPAGGVVLMSGMEPPAYAKWGESIAAAFRSLRAGPAATAGASMAPAPVAATAPGTATGQPVPYDDPNGLYAIDLPPGYTLKSADENTARFEEAGGEGWFQLASIPASSDLETISGAVRKILGRLLPNAKPDGNPIDLSINGRPARWTVCRGTITAGGLTQWSVGLGGSLSLPKSGVMLVAVLPPGTYAKCGDAILASFKTLRQGSGARAPGAATSATPAPAVGAARPPGTVTKEAFGATSTVNADGTTTFTHPAGSFDLPPGWRVDKPTGGLTFAQFLSPNGFPLSFMIGPRGYRSSKTMCEGAEAQLHRGAPQLKLQPQGQYEVDSRRGNKVTLGRYQGPFTLEGREVDGHGFTAWGKADRGLILGVGIAVGEKAAADIDDMEKIARSLR